MAGIDEARAAGLALALNAVVDARNAAHLPDHAAFVVARWTGGDNPVRVVNYSHPSPYEDRALWADRVRCGVRDGDVAYLRIKTAPNDAYDPNPGNSPTERVEIQARRELVQFDHPVWYAFRFRLEAAWAQGAVENRKSALFFDGGDIGIEL